MILFFPKRSAIGMIASQNEEQRQAALDALELDDFASTAFDDLTRMAADVLETPMACLSIIDRDRGWVQAHVGPDVPVGGPREGFLSAHAIRHPQELLVVEDTTKDERFAANPFVTRRAPCPLLRRGTANPVVRTRDRRPVCHGHQAADDRDGQTRAA